MSPLLWDEGNRKHAMRHGVSIAEIEEVFARIYIEIVREMQEWDTEVQLRALGTTAQGRLVTIAYTEREGRPRPVTAWPMTAEEESYYVENIQKEV